MIDGTPRIIIGEPLRDRLSDVDLIRQLVPPSAGRQVVDQALGLVTEVGHISHAFNLCCDQTLGNSGWNRGNAFVRHQSSEGSIGR